MNATEQVKSFVGCLYEPDDWAEIRLIRSGGVATKRWVHAKNLLGEIVAFQKLNRQGLNIYAGPNPRTAEGLSGDENVKLCRCLFADFDHIETGDGESPSEVVSMVVEEKGLPVPTMMVCSGHGLHCYWRLDEPLPPEEWRCLQERLNFTLGSDKTIKNPERIMRVPGFLNTKSEPHVESFIVDADPKSVYPLSAIEPALADLPKETPSQQQDGPSRTQRPPVLEVKGRAMLYAAKWPSCSEGERNSSAYQHAAQLVRDFDLCDSDAWEILQEWNRRNDPPLEERELRQAFADAKKYGKRPIGSKNQPRQRARTPIVKESQEPADEVEIVLEATIDGRRRAIAWPWPWMTGLTKALLPGTVTLLCGTIGASKSFMLLEAFAFWFAEHIRVALFALEESVDYHLVRVLAQRAENANLTDPDWVREHPGETRQAFAEYRDFLDAIGRALWASPDCQPTLEQLGNWLEQRARDGCRIICVDPITAAAQTSEPWIWDNAFLQRAKRAATEYGVSIVVVTHAKKGGAHLVDMDSLAGSAAYARFAQTICWLESHDDKVAKAKDVCGTTQVESNRTLHILKARNARGGGLRLAFKFSSETLKLTEYGIVVKEKKTGGSR